MRVADIATGTAITIVPISKAEVLRVRYNPKKKLLATLGKDRWVQIWDITGKAAYKDVPVSNVGPECISWSSDGTILAIGTLTGQIQFRGLRCAGNQDASGHQAQQRAGRD